MIAISFSSFGVLDSCLFACLCASMLKLWSGIVYFDVCVFLLVLKCGRLV